MKLPCEALLEFQVKERSPTQCSLEKRALFKTGGLFRILYWYSVLPLRNVVLHVMLEGI
jgi:hypothetical protein